MRILPTTVLIPCIAALLAVFLLAAPAGAEPTVPADGTAERALLDGLKLIRDGKFDAWISQFCSTNDLCYTDHSIKSLKKYNLPTIQRLADQCIKGTGDALDVTRTVVKDKDTKVFIQCGPQAQPRPFTMVKEPKGWRFKVL